MTYQEEHEQSFSIPSEHLERVLDVIWPKTEALIAGATTYQLLEQSVRTTIHMYSDRTDFSERERLKLSAKNGEVRVVRQHKVIAPGRKFEQLVTKPKKGDKAVAAINTFGPIIGAFLKERATLEYGAGEQSLKIALDAMVPFDPRDPLVHGETVYHVEFEGSTAAAVATVIESDTFSAVAPYVRGLDIPDTKWVLASPFCPEKVRLSFASIEDLQAYYDRVITTLAPRRLPLDAVAPDRPARKPRP